MADDKGRGRGSEGEAAEDEYGESFYHEIGQDGNETMPEGSTHELTDEERVRGKNVPQDRGPNRGK